MHTKRKTCASIPNGIQLWHINNYNMSVKSAMIRARIEPKTKIKAEEILKNLGLNPTDAISIFYSQIIIKKGIPFTVDLETNDTPDNYTKINSDKKLKSLLKLK